jgi:hypothetical protein
MSKRFHEITYSIFKRVSSGGIHEPLFDKRLKSFALCYSQSLLLADFTHSYGFLIIEFSTVTGGGGNQLITEQTDMI